MSDLRRALRRLGHHPVLRDLTTSQILAFCRLTSCLKNDILLVQHASIPVDRPPRFLSVSLVHFLAEAMSIHPNLIQVLWEEMRFVLWGLPSSEEALLDDEGAFHTHGEPRGITRFTMYPPSAFCTNPDCHKTQTPLKTAEQREVVLFTLADGVQPAWNIHLSCPACRTNFHNNYYVQKGKRIYYGGMPKYLQVGEHQFVEDRVVNMWITNMLISWVSATNASRSYEMSLSQRDKNRDMLEKLRFVTVLTVENIWDAFILYTLIGQHERDRRILVVDHEHDQNVRFKELMEERNEHVIMHGQDEVDHYCDKCTKFWVDADGIDRVCQPLVTDGLTLGHPCCGHRPTKDEPTCTNPLDNNRHRFCLEHSYLNNQCSIVECTRPILPGSKACDLPLHQDIERQYTARGKASFTLTQRLRKYRDRNHEPEEAEEAEEDDTPLEEEEDTWFVQDGETARLVVDSNPATVGELEPGEERLEPLPCPAKKSDEGKKIRAQFARKRVHNEQTLMFPCGIFFARASFYNAEAVSNVLIFLKHACSVRRARVPELFIYDSACDAKQQVVKWHDPFFDDIGFVVDVWHFLNKHSVKHKFCQEHCNPAAFPELKNDDGTWAFNTSICEQGNNWLGAFRAMCREMGVVKFNFFLDEMIRLKNQLIIEQLRRQGYNPRNRP